MPDCKTNHHYPPANMGYPPAPKPMSYVVQAVNTIPEKPYACSYCTKTFSNRNNLKYHMSTHLGGKPYKCKSCEYRTAYPSGIYQHNKEGMNADQQALARSVRPCDLGKTICEYCQKDFVYPARLLRHRRVHTGERPFKCESCQKSFTQKVHLKLHTRTHTGEKPFKCDQCSYAASDISSLKKHAAKHAQKTTTPSQ
ncbi:zinc finger protein 2 homolog [Galendromus occidentalis]|uniref:Zinc finger protein 2 homolog n=1 Tax=Galendromus occidentalis TaxID=34638 RepID=A0AAJ7SGM9_9ACAR|nr:zinc finger protein 2 homolog [Galendromus occidentalis]